MSRGRRDVRRSLTTLLVLGSITIRLLVFSLLTKTRPVSFAHPARGKTDSTTANATIANAEMLNGAGNRRGMGTGDPLFYDCEACLRKRSIPAYDLSKRPGK